MIAMSTENKKTKTLPAFCPACDVKGKIWCAVDRAVEQIFRKEHFTVEAEVSECVHCGFRLLMDAQADKLARLTADAYRRKYGLLTSTEIVSRRKAMNMSQVVFAAYLQTGVASVKRWEGAWVQEAGSDRLMRELTDHALCFIESGHNLQSPKIDTLVLPCTSGFKDWMDQRWKQPSHKAREPVMDCSIQTFSFSSYAFTATA